MRGARRLSVLASWACRRGAPSLNREDSLFYTPPEAFGPFRVLHQIGAGVLGPVFRTHESGGERLVAVKVFRLDITPEQARALARELSALSHADLSRTSIASPIAAGVEGTVAYLAEEYVAGESLDVTLQQPGSIPLAEVLRLVEMLADSLDAAATTGIHHGALHPRDIIVSAGIPRITGWGVAQALERVGARAPIRRPYSAPERVAGSEWSAAADVFALAAIAHELMFGRRVASSPEQIPESLSAIDGAEREPLREAFSRALSPDPVDRHGSARAFADALRVAAQERDAVPAPPPVAIDHQAAPGRGRASEWRPTLPLDLEPEAFELATTPPLSDIEASLDTHASFDPVESDDVHDDFSHGEPLPHEDPPPFEIQRRPGVLHETSHLTVSASAITPEWPLESKAPVPHAAPAPTREASHHDVDLLGARAQSPPVLPTPPRPQFRSRGVAPMITMLLIGILIGGIGGYELAFRTAAPRDASLASDVDTPRPSGTSGGREWTERSVQDNPTNAVPPVPPESSVVTPAPGATVSAPANRGQLLVRSTPAGSQVLVNGSVRGLTPLTLKDVPYGTQTVRVIRPGYQPQQRRVSVSATNRSPSVEVSLKPVSVTRVAPAPSVGSLSIASRPAGAIVYVDGRRVGTTPLELSTLSAGSHALRVEHAGYRLWSSSVKIVSGGRARVTASLVKGTSR